MAASRRDNGVGRQRADFAAFYESSRDDCLRAVTASTGSRQVAEDAVAEAFARAWASWSTVARHPSPRAWVVRTALNTHISWWRRRRREVPGLAAPDDARDDSGDLMPVPALPAGVHASEVRSAAAGVSTGSGGTVTIGRSCGLPGEICLTVATFGGA